MSPEQLEVVRRLAEEARCSPGTSVDPDLVLDLLDHLEASRASERRLRDQRNRAARRAEEAEAAVVALRDELDEVTDGWFDAVAGPTDGPACGRPLLRAIEGGAGA